MILYFRRFELFIEYASKLVAMIMIYFLIIIKLSGLWTITNQISMITTLQNGHRRLL